MLEDAWPGSPRCRMIEPWRFRRGHPPPIHDSGIKRLCCGMPMDGSHVNDIFERPILRHKNLKSYFVRPPCDVVNERLDSQGLVLDLPALGDTIHDVIDRNTSDFKQFHNLIVPQNSRKRLGIHDKFGVPFCLQREPHVLGVHFLDNGRVLVHQS